MRLFFILLALTSFFINAKAQINDQLARQKYKVAKEAYENKNYKECVTNLYKAEELLGKTNVKILPLLIRSFDAISAWQYVVQNYERYTALSPDTALIEFDEIKAISENAKQEMVLDSARYKSICINGTISDCDKYLAEHTYGIFRDDVSWYRAKKENYLESYYSYIDQYPNGKYYSNAMQIINQSDKNAYEKAISEGTQYSLNYYLDYYIRGNYRNKVSKKLEERIEYDLYNLVISSKDYDNYLTKYPNGRYSADVNEKNKEMLYSQGLQYYKSKNYDFSLNSFNKYIDKYPSEANATVAQKMIKKCERKLNQRGIDVLTVMYDTEMPSLGFGYETFKLNKIGGYINFRIHPVFFTLLSSDGNTINNKNETNVSNVTILDTKKTGVIGISGGLTFKVLYPLWIGLGVGVSSYPVFVKAHDNTLDEDIWLKNTDQSSVAIVPQCNLNLKISKGVLLKVGLMYHKGMVGQFGLGFKL